MLNIRSRRCQFINITNQKRCKNKFRLTSSNTILHKDNINSRYLCLGHMNYTSLLQKHNCYAKIIQRIYRGYRARKALNNIYKKLPDDIQSYIVHKYFREDFYNKKFIRNLSLVINEKIYKKLASLSDQITSNRDHFLEFVLKNEDIFINVCYLINKYYSLVKFDYIYMMKITLQDFRYLIRAYYQYTFAGIGDYTTSQKEEWEYYLKLNSLYHRLNEKIQKLA